MTLDADFWRRFAESKAPGEHTHRFLTGAVVYCNRTDCATFWVGLCDWKPDDLNPGPECPYCAGEMCARFDGLGCTHNAIERHGYPCDDCGRIGSHNLEVEH